MKPVRIDTIKNQGRFRFAEPIDGTDLPGEWRKIRHEKSGTTVGPVGGGTWRVVPNSTKVHAVITNRTPVALSPMEERAANLARELVRAAFAGNPFARALVRDVLREPESARKEKPCPQ